MSDQIPPYAPYGDAPDMRDPVVADHVAGMSAQFALEGAAHEASMRRPEDPTILAITQPLSALALSRLHDRIPPTE